MSNRKISPTPYPEVNVVLKELLSQVQEILGYQFAGMYLYGSLAYGGFDSDSDIDYVVVTTEEPSEGSFSRLQAMHTRLAALDIWCATQMEGSYIPLHALQQYDPARALYLHIDRGREEHLHRMLIDDARLSRAWWGGWVFLRAVLWENGIVLAGPDPRTIIEHVSPDELKQANFATLKEWFRPLLDHPSELANCGYQSYYVLTLCRILYTLEHGAIVSKQVAAYWAQKKLGDPWTDLIERACAGRHNPDTKAQAVDVSGTMDFIRYTLEISQCADPK